MLEKCWICGCLGHIAVECKEKTVTCFSCGQRGHKQEDCISPMANCWNCGKRGHIKKDCPVKMNVGMCFYCHKVGHHSKDCDKKVCYICESKDHLWTLCPLKGARGFHPRRNRYMSRMRHLQHGQDYQKTFQQKHFSKQLLFDSQCYQPSGQEQQVPRCIRSKSVPIQSEQVRAAAHERPMILRRNSEPVGYSASFVSSLEHSQVPQSLDDYELMLNQSCLNTIAPHVGSVGLSMRSDQDGSGFSIADGFSRSDGSSMKVTESENDSVVPALDSRLIQSVIADWKKDISREPEHDLPTWCSSEVWWNNGFRVELNNPQARSLLSQSEKQEVQDTYDSVDLSCNKDKKDCGENTILDARDDQAILVQDQLFVQPTQQSQTKRLDVLNVRDEAASEAKVGTISNVINTNNRSPTTSSVSTNSSSIHESVSTMSSGKQQDGKAQTVEGFVPEATAREFKSNLSNADFLEETGTKGNDVHEELKRMREQLAEAKIKLNEKEEQLDKTQKMVDALKRVIFLDSSVKKKVSPKKHEQSIKGEDVSDRCPSCIQILKDLESCEKCMM